MTSTLLADQLEANLLFWLSEEVESASGQMSRARYAYLLTFRVAIHFGAPLAAGQRWA
jgi:hypothetical protein